MTSGNNISVYLLAGHHGDPSATPDGYLMYNNSGATTEQFQNVPSSTAVVDEDTALKWFSAKYQGIHGYVSIVVCVFGIVLNIMNIVVLTQKNMITSTNYILTALAIADMFTMVSKILFNCVSLHSLIDRILAPCNYCPHPSLLSPKKSAGNMAF